MRRCECQLMSCRYCRERLQKAGKAGFLKPGPARSCQCGGCKTCKNRIARAVFYQRNKDAISRANSEHQKALRGSAGAKNSPAPSPPTAEL